MKQCPLGRSRQDGVNRTQEGRDKSQEVEPARSQHDKSHEGGANRTRANRERGANGGEPKRGSQHGERSQGEEADMGTRANRDLESH